MSNTTRRSFLGRSAAALGAAPAVIRSFASAAPSDRIRVGLIGCGGISGADLPTFFLNPEVDCPVVCDIDDERLAKRVGLVEKHRQTAPDTVKDFRRVIDRKDIDVCLICTPDHWHALPTIYACQAGKDVYVEKPLATSIGEGRAMVTAARNHKRIVQMGTQWRSGLHYQEAVDFVRSGKLGRIRQVRAWAYLDWVGGIGKPADSDPLPSVDYNMWLGPAPERPFNKNRFHFNFRWFWDYAGGLMTDWGVHLINIALWAMGPEPPRSVTSAGGKFVVNDNSETPDTQIAVYDFPSYTLVWEHQMLGGIGPGGRPHGLSFSGTEGTLILDADGWEIHAEPKKKTLGEWTRKVNPQDRTADGRPAHVRNFLDCVRSRQDPVENVELGHFVSTVAHLGNVALRTGRKIEWDAATERATGLPEADRFITYPYRKPWSLT
jgi:predicted dehydrogenase